ncbi:MAG: T9SS type A sorting domain-containing protein, partial [Saprospiraceae bacterium]|nr:T9SS type A sorting domain-containing protein [Saprospiraceae bacterium]
VFTILYKAPEAQTLSMEVSDALGRIMLRSSAALGQGDNKIPLDLQGAAAGVYFVRLGSETEGYTVKKLIHKG